MQSKVALFGITLGACAMSALPEDDETQIATAAVSTAGDCSTTVCGSNSPVVRLYGFHNLRLDGQPNAARLSLIAMTKDKDAYAVTVRQRTLYGLDVHGNVALAGPDLAGAVLWLRSDRGERFGIIIQAVGQVNTAINGIPVETYELVWGALERGSTSPDRIKPGPIRGKPPQVSAERTNVCNPNTSRNGDRDAAWDESFGLKPQESVLFEGDVVIPADLRVDPSRDAAQFNIGCGMSALAKLLLTESTMDFTGDWRRSTATLKMLTANYCPGETFTVSGQPLVWRNGYGMNFRATPAELEARWDENGLVCLHRPRVETSKFPPAVAQYPDVWTDIAKRCGALPRCADVDPWNTLPGEIVTSGTFVAP